MSIFEYDQERHIKQEREEAWKKEEKQESVICFGNLQRKS